MKGLVFILLLVGSVAEATHLRSGYISFRQESPGSLTIEIKITIYLNCGSDIRFGDGILDFGDGQTLTSPSIENTPRPDLGPLVCQVVFTTTHTYAIAGIYLVSYTEPNRVAGIVNMDNSVETRFYVESQLNLHYDLPEITFVAPPVFRATLGNLFSAGMGVTDEAGYKFQYYLVSPMKGRGEPVQNYSIPNDVKLETNRGHFTWPLHQLQFQLVGTYVFALRVAAYDTDDNYVGFTTYDFQIEVEDGDIESTISDNLDLDLAGKVYTADKDSIKVVLEGDRPEWKVNLYTALSPTSVSMVTTDSVANGKYYKVNWVKFKNTDPSIRRYNPYVVIVRSSLFGLGCNTQDISYLFFTEADAFNDYITAVADDLPEKLSVYPNPFERYLQVNGNSEDVLVRIYLTNGKEVLSQLLEAGKSLDLTDLPQGIYIARISGVAFRLVKN